MSSILLISIIRIIIQNKEYILTKWMINLKVILIFIYILITIVYFKPNILD